MDIFIWEREIRNKFVENRHFKTFFDTTLKWCICKIFIDHLGFWPNTSVTINQCFLQSRGIAQFWPTSVKRSMLTNYPQNWLEISFLIFSLPMKNFIKINIFKFSISNPRTELLGLSRLYFLATPHFTT